MDNLDEQVFAVVKRYMDTQQSLTDEGVKKALPSVDMKDIKASLQRLQDQRRIIGVPLNVCIPNILKKC